MCKGQFTVNQRYDFNPLPFQDFRWHKSTFFSLRAAVFKIDASHLEMTPCPRHRDSLGSRWQSGRPIFTIPDKIASAAHKSSSVKGLCGLRSNHSACSVCLLSHSRSLFQRVHVSPFRVSRILYFHCLSGYLYSLQQKY